MTQAAAFLARLLVGASATPHCGHNPVVCTGELRYHELFDNTTDIVYTHDLAGRITAANRAAERITGFSRAELLDMEIQQLAAPDSGATVQRMILEQYGGGVSQGYDLELRSKTGETIPVEVSAHLLFEQGRPIGLMGFARDVSGRKRESNARELAEKKLRESRRQMSRFHSQWDRVRQLAGEEFSDSGEVIGAYLELGAEIFGLPIAFWAKVCGGICTVLAEKAEPGCSLEGKSTPVEKTVLGAETCPCGGVRVLCSRPQLTLRVIEPGGAGCLLWAPVRLTTDSWRIIGFATRGIDADPGERAEQVIEFMAHGLGNQLMARQLEEVCQPGHDNSPLERNLERILAESRESRGRTAVVMLDVDLLRNLNERFGYETCDALLRRIELRLRRLLGERGWLGRLGSHRWAVILPGVNHSEAESISEELSESIRRPFRDVRGREISVTISGGFCLAPRDGRTPRTLLSKADAAMRHAKRSGRDTVHSYALLRRDRVSRWLKLEVSLPAAIENGEFRLRFQPQVRLTGQLERLEALLAWKHPKLGLLSAGSFIPLAEQNGMIVPIGRWVLRQACRQLSEWRQAGHHSLKLAVNVSTVQLTRPDFPGIVADSLNEYGLSPALLELELTESTLMKEETQSLCTLNALRKLGATLAIDDFGIGYSSLSYLSRLPVNTVKIDRSFLRNTDSPGAVLTMITAIVTMAHSLGLQVVAEGVEQQSELDMLREAGCDCVQGYLVGRPMSAEDVTHLLQQTGLR